MIYINHIFRFLKEKYNASGLKSLGDSMSICSTARKDGANYYNPRFFIQMNFKIYILNFICRLHNKIYSD